MRPRFGEQGIGDGVETRRVFWPETPQTGEQRVRDRVERLEGAITGETFLDVARQAGELGRGRSPTANRSSSARPGQSVRSMARPRVPRPSRARFPAMRLNVTL